MRHADHLRGGKPDHMSIGQQSRSTVPSTCSVPCNTHGGREPHKGSQPSANNRRRLELDPMQTVALIIGSAKHLTRSEERRVGKECRSRCSRNHEKQKKEKMYN